jgi:hypothetical protein
MSHDWVPDADAAFDALYEKYCRVVNLRTAGPTPAWPHVPPERVTELNDGFAGWHTAYERHKASGAHRDAVAKKLARTAGERVLRLFNKEFILNSTLVSGQDKVDMGNRPRRPRAPVADPHTRPEFFLALVDIRRLGVHFWDQDRESKARPYGVIGALICWAVLDHPPAGIGELTNAVLATRTPHTLEFTDAERGKTVYIALRWQNGKGRLGPWSGIQSAIIP